MPVFDVVMPLPVTTSTLRLPAAWARRRNASSSSCASCWVRPCRSILPSIVSLPLRKRSAWRRSMPWLRPWVSSCGLAGAAAGCGLPGGAVGAAGFAALGFAGGALGAASLGGAGFRLDLIGRTVCATCRHNSSSSGVTRRFAIALGFVDHDDVQPLRPMRAHQDGLLDVAAARRAGDEVQGARHGLAILRLQPGP